MNRYSAGVFSALIIDADHEATHTIEGALRPFGFEFTSTQDEPEAMTLAKTVTPDIIFLRVELPTVSGFKVCNNLRRSDETKYIPLVMYASGISDDVFNKHRALKTHADEYIRLPFNDGRLLDVVRNLIPIEEGATAGVPDAGGLEVDIDDIEDEHRSSAGTEDSLQMREFDAEFDEIARDTGAQASVPSPPPPEEIGLGAETDAAFDALTLEEAGTETAAEIGDVSVQPASTEPEPEPEPRPQAQAQPRRATPPPAPAPASPPRATDTPSTPIRTSEPEPTRDREASALLRIPEGEEGASGEFKAQREVIQLKAQVNAKNREILGLKEELESRDRAALDLKHKNRELLAQIGDIEEKLVAAEEQTISANERTEAAARDKATVLKREDGLKARLEHAQKKTKDLEDELATVRASHQGLEQRIQGEQAALTAKLEVSLRELSDARERIGELDRDLADARSRGDELAGSLDGARARSGELNEMITRLEEEAAGLRREIDRVRREGDDERDRMVAEVRQSALADKAAALRALADEHTAETEFEENQHRTELEKLRGESAEVLAGARAEVEKLREMITESELQAQTAREQAANLLSETRREAAAREAQLTAERDRTRAALDRESENLHQSMAELERTRLELARTGAELDARRDAIRRAEQAIAVALRVLDERGQ